MLTSSRFADDTNLTHQLYSSKSERKKLNSDVQNGKTLPPHERGGRRNPRWGFFPIRTRRVTTPPQERI
ncbi:hypothetical protein EAF00_000664 [Botryotinia globosa]|nr:hypothetical protein EAF00_000664 [Botryotinia globosa]